jgi:thiamine pyrophosphate-dependent acetolactate synthase large subunit-like protein
VVWNQNFGCLGTGLPYAVRASIADDGKRPVLFTTSDSAFLYQIAELELAHRFNLPIVTVVAVDNAWGLEVGVYKRTFGYGNTTEPGVHWSKEGLPRFSGTCASTSSPRASVARARMWKKAKSWARPSRRHLPAASRR